MGTSPPERLPREVIIDLFYRRARSRRGFRAIKGQSEPETSPAVPQAPQQVWEIPITDFVLNRGRNMIEAQRVFREMDAFDPDVEDNRPRAP